MSLFSISNRAALAKAVHIEKLMRKNKVDTNLLQWTYRDTTAYLALMTLQGHSTRVPCIPDLKFLGSEGRVVMSYTDHSTPIPVD